VKDCTFCQIIARKAPARILAEDDDSIVFLSRENHPLVVPKQHVPDLFGLSYALGAAVMRQTIQVARAVKKGLRCDGLYLTQANGTAAGQDVFHLHMHIYPRWQPGTAHHVDLAGLDDVACDAMAAQIMQSFGIDPE
jgi:histidine triad (HIT) family protein